ncbi:hypothetical protein GRF29_161g1453166 [Pseudopithomyces chartarum]|uniref:Uncharacterized protein n=1 Tax=Pseudopithomyces chartarum TaxID=1892770 RepID=A0AAN6LRL1_9PLEO|nr:hypothetical protein GRF29_161g1453166 [Pseudopithomyces chartarum]
MTATLETLPVEILQEIATCLLPLAKDFTIVHHEEFGAAVKRVAWMFGPTHPLHVPREGYEPLQDNRYDGRSEDDEFKAILDSQIQTVGVEGLDAGTAMFLDYMCHMPNLHHITYSSRQSDHSMRLKQIVSAVALAGTRLTSLNVHDSANIDNTCILPIFNLPHLTYLEKFELSFFYTATSNAYNREAYHHHPLLTCLTKMPSLQDLTINNRNPAEKCQIGPYLTWHPQRSSLRSLELQDTTFCETHVSPVKNFLSHHRVTLRRLWLITCDLKTSPSRASGTDAIDWPAIFGELKHFSALENVYLTELGYDKRAGYFASQGKVDMRDFPEPKSGVRDV